jgi:hypothetical protein
LAVNTTTHKERERERERESEEDTHPSLSVLSQTLSVCVSVELLFLTINSWRQAAS